MQKEAANFASVWKCLYITYIFMWNNYICVYLVGARGGGTREPKVRARAQQIKQLSANGADSKGICEKYVKTKTKRRK